MDYRPTAVGEAHRYTEVVVFDNGQVLPRYVVQLQAARSGMNQQSIMQAALREKVESEQRLANKLERLGFDPTSQASGGGSSTIPTPPLPMVSSPTRPSSAVAGGGGSASAQPVFPPTVAISSPVSASLPAIARGNEAIYELFRGGRLLYEGREVAQIATTFNPATLEGTFDLSRCGDAGRYLSIHTGYRKGKRAENKDKLEIWFVPKFLVERDLATTAAHFRPIMDQWTAPIGIFWTWGNWDNLGWYDYLVRKTPEELTSKNLYENWCNAPHSSQHRQPPARTLHRTSDNALRNSSFMFIL